MYFPWSFPIVGILFYLFLYEYWISQRWVFEILGEKASLGKFFFVQNSNIWISQN